MTNQKSKFSRGVNPDKSGLPSRLKSPTISKHKIMNDQTFPYHCEERDSSLTLRNRLRNLVRPFLSLRGTTVPKQSRWGQQDCHALPTCHCEADEVSRSNLGGGNGIATHFPPVIARLAKPAPFCHCEADEVSRSNLGGAGGLP